MEMHMLGHAIEAKMEEFNRKISQELNKLSLT